MRSWPFLTLTLAIVCGLLLQVTHVHGPDCGHDHGAHELEATGSCCGHDAASTGGPQWRATSPAEYHECGLCALLGHTKLPSPDAPSAGLPPRRSPPPSAPAHESRVAPPFTAAHGPRAPPLRFARSESSPRA